MADQDADEDLFADLYDGEDVPAAAPPPAPVSEPTVTSDAQKSVEQQPEPSAPVNVGNTGYGDPATYNTTNDYDQHDHSYDDMGHAQMHDAMESRPEERPIGIKEDGKMFIGGLNWETTDQSLKDYFSEFGEVIECTVMRDGATGRSRGFGFLTFKDPKVVNTVMVKEHSLDGKLIDPKRAIPRDEQERTAKIFVGGVSQEATETDFKEFFMKFGRVLDATLMMDKDTGRPRGFGFVTFDSDTAVERTLEGPLAILGKPIEVKRAQPRGKMGEEDAVPGKFGRGAKGGNQFSTNGGFNNMSGGNTNQMEQAPGNGNAMTPAMMAQYWQRMQQYFAAMSGMNNGMNMMGGGGMQNPMMQQMMAARQQGGMNPMMMQQMAAMQQGGFGGNGGAMPGSQSPGENNGNGSTGQQGNGQAGYGTQEQLMFEQQKYERQQMARMQQQGFGNQNTWDGMYDDIPAPAGMQGGGRGGGGFRGGRGGGQRAQAPAAPPGSAPANAPTGPKNAGRPGANYRGGGRGGHGGRFEPYGRSRG